jgi:hypothetical protein
MLNICTFVIKIPVDSILIIISGTWKSDIFFMNAKQGRQAIDALFILKVQIFNPTDHVDHTAARPTLLLYEECIEKYH